jgi:hypothetical protein
VAAAVLEEEEARLGFQGCCSLIKEEGRPWMEQEVDVERSPSPLPDTGRCSDV